MNRSVSICAVVWLILAPAQALGQTIYKCPPATPGAPPVIQQMPCSPTGGGETITVHAPKPAGEGGLRDSENDALLKSDPRLLLRAAQKELVDAQINAEDAQEKSAIARRKLTEPKNPEQSQ